MPALLPPPMPTFCLLDHPHVREPLSGRARASRRSSRGRRRSSRSRARSRGSARASGSAVQADDDRRDVARRLGVSASRTPLLALLRPCAAARLREPNAGRALRQSRIPAPGDRRRDRDGVEQKAGREGGVGVDAEAAQEGDEERLAHAEAVDRERHHHDEEEQRPEDHVDEQREVEPDRLAAEPDRDDAHELEDDA